MPIEVEIQREADALPTDAEFAHWVEQVLASEQRDDAELTIRIVDAAESAQLNEQYRHKNGPTNVLSFPFEAPPQLQLNLLGDLVICADVVAAEARQQHKREQAHWAHMVVHGTLHLLGYDHIEDTEAQQMENREMVIMQQLGFDDPYQETV